MKSLKTLVDDIYALWDPKKETVIPQEHLDNFTKTVSNKLVERLGEDRQNRSTRMSNVGNPCHREMWYWHNTPHLARKQHPSTLIKFFYGDILEALMLMLAKVAGHSVTDEQTKLDFQGVPGSCDGVIDGVLVDVKSASPLSFKKFEKHLDRQDDTFGYLTQLGLYNHAKFKGENKPAAFLAVDKVHGTLKLDVHHDLSDVNYLRLVSERKQAIELPEPPDRPYTDEPEGKSGNRSLKVKCSYCRFSKTCWPGLRAFSYSGDSVTYLTHVERLPRVPEIEA